MKRSSVAYCLVSVFVVGAALLADAQHDYIFYLEQWAATAAGHDPWAVTVDGRSISRNAYGPLLQVFVPLAGLNRLLPKMLFVALVLAIYAELLRRSDGASPARCALMFPLHPAVFIAVVLYGNNDIVPAAFVVLACWATASGLRGLSGSFLGLGALAKFYPLLFAGLLAGRGEKRLDVRVPLAALTVFVAGMIGAYEIWGESIFSPFHFGHERGPKTLSILRFLSFYAPNLELVRHLLVYNSSYVVAAVLFVGLHGWLARLDWQTTLLIGILVVFSVYKVGHPQFYVTWLAVQAWILAGPPHGGGVKVARAFLPVSIFLGAFQIVFFVSGLTGNDDHLRGHWFPVRVWAGPTFLSVVAWSLWRSRTEIFRRWQRPPS